MRQFELSHVLAQLVVNERDGEGHIINRHLLPVKELYHPHDRPLLELIRGQMAELQKQPEPAGTPPAEESQAP